LHPLKYSTQKERELDRRIAKNLSLEQLFVTERRMKENEKLIESQQMQISGLKTQAHDLEMKVGALK